MRNVVKDSMRKLWESFLNWIKIFMFGTELSSEIPEYRENIVEQYSIVKWNLNRIYNGTENVLDDRALTALHDLADRTRIQAMQACSSSITAYERQYMNGILRDMTDAVDELEKVLYSIDHRVFKREEDNVLQYIIDRAKYMKAY